jgi:acyl carrier protein
MSNLEKYKSCYSNAFSTDSEAEIIFESLEYQGIKEWDSVGHMALIANIEDLFGVMLDMEDVISFSSFQTGIEILAKYDIKII